VVEWVVTAAGSALVGLVVGSVIAAVVHRLKR
jgi:predicted DNA repair protein MutK